MSPPVVGALVVAKVKPHMMQLTHGVTEADLHSATAGNTHIGVTTPIQPALPRMR